jgi:hypothetical protein
MNNFKQEVPNPQKHQPQVVQLSPLQAAGKLYKIDETNQLSMSSFQVPTKNYFNYYLINLYSLHYKNGTLQHFFPSKGRQNSLLHSQSYCYRFNDKMVL